MLMLEKAFLHVDVNRKVLLFNETILNIIRNFQKQSSGRQVFHKKGVLRNFANFTENTSARVSFLIQFQA